MKSIMLLAAPFLAVSLLAQAPAAPPRITGAAHMAYYVSDLQKARAYYVDFLGFEEAFALKNADGSDHVAFIKINDRQYIELFVEPPTNHGFLHDAGFETGDARGVRAFFASLGVKVPETVSKDLTGNRSFSVTDPFGFTIEIVQYEPDSRTAVGTGKYMPANRISTHIDHLGLLIGDREEAAKYYHDTFGFVSEGDGSKQRIGDGPDRFELGFERKPPTAARFHVKNHICLSVPDVPKVAEILRAKPAAKTFREIETHVLDNGKHVAELYDLDGNRVELMEPPKGK
jgi:catechol 2,3-dioxygenase-like lactoylglutathione lyase family enzyme